MGFSIKPYYSVGDQFMPDYVEVPEAKDLSDGQVKRVKVGGEDILLAKVGNNYYAIANRCPHADGNLSDGKLEGTIVTCPRHGSQWELTDGHCLRWTRNLAAVPKVNKTATYPVRVEGGRVFIAA